MRQIKFRAWSETRNKMIDSSTATTVFWPSLRFCEYNKESNQVELPLMQFTGLKDKCGVEIYEFDLLSDGHFVWVVKYSDDRFIVELKSHYNKAIGDCGLKKIITARNTAKTPVSVIGNIYANPELLNKE